MRRSATTAALLNTAATEEAAAAARPAAPSRRRPPADAATAATRLTGEKSWTTWLPVLEPALVTARIGDREAAAGRDQPGPPEVGVFVVDLEATGVTRLPGFEALGMRGSASGRLRLDRRLRPRRIAWSLGDRPAGPDPRGSVAGGLVRRRRRRRVPRGGRGSPRRRRPLGGRAPSG